MTEPTARSRILDNIRGGLRRSPDADAAARDVIQHRLNHPQRNLIPARTAGLTRPALIDRFVAQVQSVHATVDRVGGGDVPAALVRYLQRHDLPAEIVMAPDPGLDAYDWASQEMLGIRRDRALPADAVGVTAAFAGIAETGTVLLLSGALTPATLHLMPDTHIVILPESLILPTYEDGWERLRSAGAGMPRTATLVTGPSRTGDIEQRMQLGAHGPRRLHLILVRGR